METSDISVIICTRGRPMHLRNCLDSITKSDLPPLEVLVVDQSDDDATQRVVDEYCAEHHMQFLYFHVDSIGHTKARNAGVRASSGGVVAFTDDDCAVDRGWLRAIDRELQDSSINCVCGNTVAANHLDRPKSARLSTLCRTARLTMKGRCNPVSVGRGNNMAFRRSDLLRLGGFNERIGVGSAVFAGDDIDIFQRVLQAGGKVLFTPSAIVWHNQPDDWSVVIRKKRGYAISVSALFASKARCGDTYAGMLLAGKIAYELFFLLVGGLISFRGRRAVLGYHSLFGSISGLKLSLDRDFCSEVRRLQRLAVLSGLRTTALDVPTTSLGKLSPAKQEAIGKVTAIVPPER